MQNPEHGAHPKLPHYFPDVFLEIGRNQNLPKRAISAAPHEQTAPTMADMASDTESWNSLGGKGPHSSSSPTPLHGQGHLPLSQAAPSSVQPGLERSQGWGRGWNWMRFKTAPIPKQAVIP